MKPDVPDRRLGCRTVLVNPVLRVLYGKMAFHVEHSCVRRCRFTRWATCTG